MMTFSIRTAVLSLFFYLSFAACGAKEAATPASSAAGAASGVASGPWKNKTMQTLVGQKCASAGCHNGTVPPNFALYSEADMKDYTKAGAQVGASKMPPLPATLSKEEKAVFTNFYK